MERFAKYSKFYYIDFLHFFAKRRISAEKMTHRKKNRGHRTSKIVKSTQSYSNGNLPYYCSLSYLARAFNAWRGVWILNQTIDQLLLHRSTGEKQHERRRGAPPGAAMSCSWNGRYSKLSTYWYKFLNFWSLSVYTRLCLLIWFVQFLQFSLSGNTQHGFGFLNRQSFIKWCVDCMLHGNQVLKS